MEILVFQIPAVVLVGVGMKLAAYERDRLGGLLLVALPTVAMMLAITLITMVIEDWESYTDCHENCERPESLQRALDAAEVIAYGLAALLILSVVRWAVVFAGARRSSE